MKLKVTAIRSGKMGIYGHLVHVPFEIESSDHVNPYECFAEIAGVVRAVDHDTYIVFDEVYTELNKMKNYSYKPK